MSNLLLAPIRCSRIAFVSQIVSAAAVLLLSWTSVGAVQIDTVFIGNPGNARDTEVMSAASVSPRTTGYGAVNYSFRIAKTELTVTHYTEFLNAVAASDPYMLYNGTNSGITRTGTPGNYTYSIGADVIRSPGNIYTYANKPIVNISWYDAARFANWMHNGQGNGDTETGAYTLLGGSAVPMNGLSITRNPGARWFIPSENEWYKAAYYDPDKPGGAGYWNYGTGTNTPPTSSLPAADIGNNANVRGAATGTYATGSSSFPLTDVGAYTQTMSAYGAFDMAGNAWEWNEAVVNSIWRGFRGDGWYNEAIFASASLRNAFLPTQQSTDIGFRLATIVPEPTSGLLLTLGFIAGLRRRISRLAK